MFKIGEFSRLSRVSVRMLRHYDQLGLLTPSQTDSFTGYRYYSADQLPRLNRIIALRDLGFSLEQIAEMLDEDVSAEQLLGMLKLKRADVEQQMQTEQERLSRLEAQIKQMNQAANHTKYDVILRDIESELVGTYREVAKDDNRIQEMFDLVEIYIAGYENARADKPPFTIYYDDEYRDEEIDCEVCVPLKYAIPENESIRVRKTPKQFKVACVIHVGNYLNIGQAYNALLNWIDSNGYQMKGLIREIYLKYGADGLEFELPQTYLAQESNQYVTELQLAVEKL
ncbi:MAG TPA: MerR family transcriptional regulator [Anaerolineae bacterium]|nr:MerR family transcriptional regulator [Anaerolineae bacterium]HRJ76422.1 MerR family transcriptional regulator [Anaerolineales bacterium]